MVLTKENIMASPVKIDKPAPDFQLKTFDGDAISLADYHGKKNVLMVFNRGFT